MAEQRVESEGFYEMLWDCDHCGTKRLLGKSQRHCPECGGPQNPDKRYYPPPGEQTRAEGHAYVGADRTCPACSAPMGAKASNCTQCGSPLDGARAVRGVDERAPAPAPQPKRRHRGRLFALLALAVIAIGLAIWLFFIRAREATVTIASHRWERVIAIDEFGQHQQSAWRDQTPVGAELPVCVRKQRTSRQVPDGEDCHLERHDKKDGTFEQVKRCTPKTRAEPVDDDWCTFTVHGWMPVSQVKATGTGTSPAWPTTPAPATAAPIAGSRRAGARTETLTLDFGDAGTCDVADDVWRKYADGQHVKVEVRARSGEVVCGEL